MALDWIDVCRDFKGQWIALGDGGHAILGSGKTAEEALRKAKAKGHRAPVLTYIPERLGPYFGR